MATETSSNDLILVVEDDRAVRICIVQALESSGYQVLTAKDGIDALAVLESESVDLILTDIAMPRMNGYQLYEHVVENPQWVTIPFIFLTARALDSDVRYAKELGIDDYITKPFLPEDLTAAVRGKLRLARRRARQFVQPAPQPIQEPSKLTLGTLQIDPDQYRVWRGGERINLSAREFELLGHLARQPRKVVPLQELVRTTHAIDTDAAEAGELLRPLIRSLRRKLGYSAGDMGCIQNVRGIGYRLIPPTD